MLNPEMIGKIVQIASVLEVSGYPKPGNVHRTRDYDDMVFEDFLISGIVIGDHLRHLSKRTIENKDDLSKIQIGKAVYDAVTETNEWIENNTNLGIVMMTFPIGAAAAISNNMEELRDNIGKIMAVSTVEDAIYLYDAINIASAGGMGDQDEYDVTSDKAKEELIKNNQTLWDVLKISAPWDDLASELTSKMPIIFEFSYPIYSELRVNNSLNKSGVLTFLEILQKVPDTLISRKYNDEVASEVSVKTRDLLKYKDLENFEEYLHEFDNYLYDNHLNPGTTADLTAATIMVYYINNEFEKTN
ncbi:triphosphoribosyl-dephospho-CoA synthase [uncultured Methanobrevibacter sp.]|uniref:triphosphoribosyl-dephospho-CoA synthase n=1 Tax=uncultured Methanobrevibacter sp. TaxID=253161 RepID=UPI0025D1D43F|nr:triphosphoribosyl-dephospho-CoA synthase [uncultured Methanobrevibacter sp.]